MCPDSGAASGLVRVWYALLQRFLVRDRKVGMGVDQRLVERRGVLEMRIVNAGIAFQFGAFVLAELPNMQSVRFRILAHLGKTKFTLRDGLLALLDAEYLRGLLLLELLKLLLQLLVLSHQLRQHLLDLWLHVRRQLLVNLRERIRHCQSIGQRVGARRSEEH